MVQYHLRPWIMEAWFIFEQPEQLVFCVCYSSMEVGVCAEAYQGGEPLRHINTAFMTFEVLDNDRKPCTLPRIRPEPVDGKRRFQEAIARKKIRLDS